MDFNAYFQQLIYGIILLLCFPMVLPAQSEWAPIGATWYYQCGEGNRYPDNSGFYRYTSVKDTVINGKECRKLAFDWHCYNEELQKGNPYFTYVENDSLFAWSERCQSFRFISDFGASVGDTIYFSIPGFFCDYEYADSFAVRIDTIYKIDAGGRMLKYFKTRSLDDNYYFIDDYIEQIGPGWLMDINGPSILTIDGFLRCYEDAELFYSRDTTPCDFVLTNTTTAILDFSWQLSPNPTSTSLILSFEQTISDPLTIQVYAMNGRLMSEQEMKSGQQHSVGVSDFENGIYLIRLSNQQGSEVRRFVKM